MKSHLSVLPRFLVGLAVLIGGGVPGRGLGEGPGKFTLTCLEIPDIKRGAGLAVVLQMPGGKTYLYDTGSGYPEKGGWASDYNAGRDTILSFLQARGIGALDGVFISHAHYDHFGG